MADVFDLIGGAKRQFTITGATSIETAGVPKSPKAILIVEATTTFRLSQGLNITEHPVEQGTNITDHAQIKLIEASMEGIITESPLLIYGGFASIGAGAIGGAIGGTAGAITTGAVSIVSDSLVNSFDDNGLPAGGQGRIDKARSILDKLVKDKTLININIKGITANNLLITDLVYNDDVDKGNSLNFSASFKELRIVSSKTTQLEKKVAKGGAGKTGQSITQTGLNQVKDQTEKIIKEPSSIVYKLSGLGSSESAGSIVGR